jgi:hypothetical protein
MPQFNTFLIDFCQSQWTLINCLDNRVGVPPTAAVHIPPADSIVEDERALGKTAQVVVTLRMIAEQ